jgi:hypothetical protein
MLDDPRVNFAISQRGAAAGINHLGLQVDSDEELQALRRQVDDAAIAAVDQSGAACCYARSDKYWVQDPQGIAWETFRTLGAIPVFGQAAAEAAAAGSASVCCPAPANKEQPVAAPAPAATTGSKCCG